MDQLEKRDYVTGKMWESVKVSGILIHRTRADACSLRSQYRVHPTLNGAAPKETEWHCKHYLGRGLMKHFESGAALAKDMGSTLGVLAETPAGRRPSFFCGTGRDGGV